MPPEKVVLSVNPSTMRFGAFVLDTFGAPRLSELTVCGAPDLEEPPNYLGSFVLNSILHLKHNEPVGRLILMFGRRVEHAVREYRRGRELLVAYVSRLPQSNNHFLHAMRATTHFEEWIGAAYQAGALLMRVVGLTAPPDQLPAEDDRLKRLKLIWNRSKHFDDDLAKKRAGDISAPVWLTNDKIYCINTSLGFDELHSFLVDMLSELRFVAEELPRKAIDLRQHSE
jgi:hypothetical protein